MIADQPEFHLGFVLESAFVEKPSRNHVAARHLLDQALGQLLPVINFDAGNKPRTNQPRDVLAGTAGGAVPFEKRRKVGGHLVVTDGTGNSLDEGALPGASCPWPTKMTSSFVEPWVE